MTEESERVTQLKAELEELSANFEQMKMHADPNLIHYTQQLEQIRDQKLKELEEWRENEIKCAHKFKEGQEYAIDCDFKQRLNDIKTKVSGLTQFKAKILKQEFPDALKYFTEKGYDFSYLGIENKPEKTENGFVDILESNDPLLSADDVTNDIETVKMIDDWRPNDVKLGAEVSIQMPMMPPLIGTVIEMDAKWFSIKLKTDKVITISNVAINSGSSKISIL